MASPYAANLPAECVGFAPTHQSQNIVVFSYDSFTCVRYEAVKDRHCRISSPLRREDLSIPTQALTLSVVRRYTVEGSNLDDTRLIALSCFEAKANVPGRISDIHQLRCISFSHQSAFNWFDLRSYDIRMAGECKLFVYIHRQKHPFTAPPHPPCQGCGYGEAAIPLASMRKHSTSY
jgi:hypothetical protein